jgi:hypothetical protein
VVLRLIRSRRNNDAAWIKMLREHVARNRITSARRNPWHKEAWRYNASAVLRGKDDRWELALIGTNLSNDFRIVTTSGNAATGGGTGTTSPLLVDILGNVSDPCAITLQATVKFYNFVMTSSWATHQPTQVKVGVKRKHICNQVQIAGDSLAAR